MALPVDKPEFSDDDLRAALQDIGVEVRRAALRANLPLTIFKAGAVVELNPKDGKEVVVKQVKANGKVAKRR